MKCKLRAVTADDIPTLRYWDAKPHVLNAKNLSGPDDEWNWAIEVSRKLPWRELLIGDVDGRAVAFLQIIDPLLEETHYWGNTDANQRAVDIWIGEEHDLGKGFGTIFMNLALDRCFSDPSVNAVIIDPLSRNSAALRFYGYLGFRFDRRCFFGDDECDVLILDREKWSTIVQKLPTIECAGAIIFNDRKFLFGKRSASAKWYADTWDVFGGHIEQFESPAEALVRELKEELSIVALDIGLPDTLVYFETSIRTYVRYHNFIVTQFEGDPVLTGSEHAKIAWFERNDLDALELPAEEYLSIIDERFPDL